MDLEKRVRSLALAVQVLGALIIGYAAVTFFKDAVDSHRSLRINREGDTLRLSSPSDGPSVVTHVVPYGMRQDLKRIAAVTPPIGIIDSQGASIDLRKLKWINFFGEPADAPTTQRIEVLYWRPLSTNSKQ